MRRIFAAGLVLAIIVSPAASAAEYNTYRCSNSTVLRVIFNEERGIATVVPYGRPSIRLLRANASGEGFRYTRGNRELRGSRQEVVWRSGRAEWTCRAAG
jgi:hypothetical protein